MNQALIDSIRKDLDALHVNDDVKSVYVPFETLGADMVAQLPSVQGKILVVSDAGLLIAVLQRLRRERLPFNNVQFLCHTEALQNFGSQLGVRTILVCYNQLDDWFKKADMGLKFDVVVGNPPYQDSVKDGKTNTGGKLWPKFVTTCSKLLVSNGHLLFVTPSSWMGDSEATPKCFKSNQMEVLDPECSRYFPGVGSTFCWYLIRNSERNSTTKIVGTNNFDVDLGKLPFLPATFSASAASIIAKVLGGSPKIPVTAPRGPQVSKGYRGDASTIAREKSRTHKFKLFHTNAQTLWTSVDQAPRTTKKVMWTLSGYFKPFFDDGESDGSDKVQFYPVTSSIEGEQVLSYLKSRVVSYIVEHACKYGGFSSYKVICALPLVRNCMWTDQELYAHFGLTQDEIDLIERTVK